MVDLGWQHLYMYPCQPVHFVCPNCSCILFIPTVRLFVHFVHPSWMWTCISFVPPLCFLCCPLRFLHYKPYILELSTGEITSWWSTACLHMLVSATYRLSSAWLAQGGNIINNGSFHPVMCILFYRAFLVVYNRSPM